MNEPRLSPRLLIVSGLFFLPACGSDSTAPGGGQQSVSVSVAPSSASLFVGDKQDFTATVTNDPGNGGVAWTITGCSGSASICGTLSSVTTTGATYTAPTTLPSGALGVTATSTSDRTKSFTAAVTVKAGGANRQIAFYSDNNGLGQAGEIYVMNGDGSGQVNLTNNPAADRGAVWSPDGSKILFVTDRDGNREVYVMNADGSNPFNVTKSAANDDGAVWSPDGSKILFVTDRDGNPEVYVMNADGSNPLNVSKNAADDFGAVWSPDGSKIVFTTSRDGNLEIYAMNVDGTNAHNLTNNATNDAGAAWSPDGTRIAFLRARPSDGYTDIFIMNADGSNSVNLTKSPSASYAFAWSPDGSKIAFEGAAVNNSLYVMRVDGSGALQLTSMQVDATLVWAPDGTKIAFSHYTGPAGLQFLQVYVMSADGSAVTQLTTSNRYNSHPAWRPR